MRPRVCARTITGPDRGSVHTSRNSYTTKGPVVRQYTLQDRVKYQLWDYTWKPDPDQPISKIVVSISEQKVYVYQGRPCRR